MKKGLISLFTVAIVCFGLLSGGMTVYAQSVGEADNNDTRENAQLIQANSETAAQAVSGSRPNQYLVKGFTSTTDNDWYKVYLTAGTQYVNCNGESFSFEVYDSDEILIERGAYTKGGFGSKAYSFEVTSAGYYYVKITGIISSPENYLLSVGGPAYAVACCAIEFEEVTMANREDEVVTFNLSAEDRLPEEAVVYMITMQGVRTTSVNRINVTNRDMDRTVRLASYTWNKTGLVSMNLELKNDWEIEFGYNKDTSFTPSIKLYYAYPVVSEFVEDEIVIRQ